MKINDYDNKTHADLYLPNWLLIFGCILMISGLGFCVGLFFSRNAFLLIGIFCIALGTAAVMCWKNQKIRVLSEDRFEYTTFLGNSYVYSFQDIKELRFNRDSMTLFVGERKVHIESCAILSRRLVTLFDNALENIGE